MEEKRKKNGCYDTGHIPFNKNLPQTEWMSQEGIENCSKTHIQFQKHRASNLSKLEQRYLPHNTKIKGTVTRRVHIHNKGKNKGKIEYEYFINIDWHGNRKPNNNYKKYLWEVANQQDLPKGYVVINIDGNPDNNDIDNLEAITRAELLHLNMVRNK